VYLTPTRYRTLGTGVVLTQTNAELQAPEGYSFLGGHVINEEHQWRTGDVFRGQKPSARVWPYMRPLIQVDSLRVNVTRTQHIDFNDQQLFVQTGLGYVEPVAAPNTTALFTSVPPWLLTSPVAYLTYDYGFHFFVTDEVMSTLSGGLLAANHQFWFTEEDVALKKNGVLVNPSDYVVDYIEGTISSSVAPAGERWQVSYHYHMPPGIAAATALVTTDMLGQAAIAGAGLLGLSGFKVEEVEVRQSAKVNFAVQPISPAAMMYLGPYKAMFTSMR